MKQVTLNIPEDRFPFFMQLVKSLNFVQVADDAFPDNQLTVEQKQTWETVKAGFEELKEVEAGKRQPRPIDELFKEIGV